MKVLALTEDGRMTYCTAPEDQRGKGRCNHIMHQKEGQSVVEFVEEAKNFEEKPKTRNNILEAI
ncbi:MAG: hypothetical protein GX913_00885, partial [Clostridiales bacterium]|nr:hypothetical protein [Clostridiales bacterium]